MTVFSPLYTFPPISWWMRVASADSVIFDANERFQKMSARNRYHICGANNVILLSVPLLHGREQHRPMSEMNIYNDNRWQTQHWRTIVSAYNRSPYFYHYESSLRKLFEERFDSLLLFNKASILWIREQLNLLFEIEEAYDYMREELTTVIDIRNATDSVQAPVYHQVFEDRLGFIPDVSMLDMLFCEGPQAAALLRH